MTKLVNIRLRLGLWGALFLALLAATPAAALSTAFTYQGLLKQSGLPATGTLQMTFKLFNTATVGTGVQQGSTVGPLAVSVTEGLFVVALDFGAGPFNGTNLWLEIDVAGTVIGRQSLTPAPYALFALNSGAPAAPSTIIPFASADPVTVTTVNGGGSGNGGLIGFGRSTFANVSSGSIDLTSGAGQPISLAFSMPRDGIISSLSAFFSTTSDLNFPITAVTITAQLYASPTPNNIFTPIPGAAVVLAPVLTGNTFTGTTLNAALSGLSIPVTARTRLLLVVSSSAAGLTSPTTVQGFVGGGLGIN